MNNLSLIDLNKEKIAFNSFKKEEPQYSNGWDSMDAWNYRAFLAQAEINELKKEEIKYKEKYGKLIGKIHALEKKLSRYESDDYVLVPRNPEISLIDLIDSLLCFPDVTTLEAYKAIIEAVEKDNVL